jgi:hypothetical protein
LTRQEEEGLTLAQEGVPNQNYTVPPAVTGEAAGVSFLAAIPGTGRVLIGRTYLSTNPYMRSVINNLNFAEVQGAGMLIADDMIVYFPNASNGTVYDGERRTRPLRRTACLGANWSITSRFPVIPGRSC